MNDSPGAIGPLCQLLLADVADPRWLSGGATRLSYCITVALWALTIRGRNRVCCWLPSMATVATVWLVQTTCVPKAIMMTSGTNPSAVMAICTVGVVSWDSVALARKSEVRLNKNEAVSKKTKNNRTATLPRCRGNPLRDSVVMINPPRARQAGTACVAHALYYTNGKCLVCAC